jgi:hypothetical protein
LSWFDIHFSFLFLISSPDALALVGQGINPLFVGGEVLAVVSADYAQNGRQAGACDLVDLVLGQWTRPSAHEHTVIFV